MIKSIGITMTGSERRAAKRANVVTAFTRAQALAMVARATSAEQCDHWATHKNKHVKRVANLRKAAIEQSAKTKLRRAAARKTASETTAEA